MAARTPPHRRPTLRHASITTLAIITLGIAAGCSGDTDDGLPPPHPGFTPTPHNTPTLHLTLEEQQAVDEANELFDEVMQLYTDLARADELSDEAIFPLEAMMSAPLNNDISLELVDNYHDGQRQEGIVTWELVKPVEVILEPEKADRTNPSVLLRYCIRADPWLTIDKVTGEPVADAKPVLAEGTHLTDARFAYFDPTRTSDPDPRWHLAVLEHVEADQSC